MKGARVPVAPKHPGQSEPGHSFAGCGKLRDLCKFIILQLFICPIHIRKTVHSIQSTNSGVDRIAKTHKVYIESINMKLIASIHFDVNILRRVESHNKNR